MRDLPISVCNNFLLAKWAPLPGGVKIDEKLSTLRSAEIVQKFRGSIREVGEIIIFDLFQSQPIEIDGEEFQLVEDCYIVGAFQVR